MTPDDDCGGLTRYVGGGVSHLAADLAEAWLVLSRATEGDGKSVRYPPEIPSAVREDWAKMVARRISGFAQTHPRPNWWPWGEREFDTFDWRV